MIDVEPDRIPLRHVQSLPGNVGCQDLSVRNIDGDGYGNGSRYGDSSHSRVAELQRRLARAGYYRGSIDGVLGPQTRQAIRAYERAHGNVG